MKSILDSAFNFASKKHQGQRYGNKPFIFHPLQVFRIIELLCPEDEKLQTAALLHDVIEDADVTKEQLQKKFGKDVADLVFEVTKTDSNTFPHLKTQRGVILKFADRTANLSNMQNWDKEKIEKYIMKSRFWKL